MLSMSRIIFLFGTTVMMYSKYQYKFCVSLVLLIIGSLTDYLDGKSARAFNVVTKFGIIFDAIADKILTIGIFISFLALNIYPSWYVFPTLVILTREFLISGLRMIAAKEQVLLAAEKSGKVKTAVQMVSSCITIGARGFKELTIDDRICEFLDKLGKVTFLVSSVLAFTSGLKYFMKYGYLLTDSAPKEK